MKNKLLNRYGNIAAVSLLLAVGTCAASNIDAPSPTQVPGNTLGTIVKTVKNSQGLTISETDINGKVVTYLYDHDGKMLGRILPDGTKVVGGS